MKVELFAFQKKALSGLRKLVALSIDNYQKSGMTQVISFTAPTGSGKTIIIASLFENIFYGDEENVEQPEAIFVWLSDSPELNKQSMDKIDLKSDKIRLDQCKMITDESFDQEVLDDSTVYFLNTQKLGKGGNLVKHSDRRQYTIWETIQNTINRKSDRLYFVIDEAHRGMQGKEAAKATSIMQKFLKGSPEDGMAAAPVVIGMTATPERFDNLAKGINAMRLPLSITPEEVRASGLLKDRIIITYPDEVNNETAILQAAADNWKDKWDHWNQYCTEQHYAQVNPIMIVQVMNGSGSKISDTDLDHCLSTIEDRTGYVFTEGEVVHCFGDNDGSIVINGLNVFYEEPSHVADNKKIKIVFFKESLSTGWDCPRAETMMSYRHASDPTYIAQLLGRMIRTPMQMHIDVDDSLNDVHLYLPYFSASTVKDIVDALQNEEGGAIPTDIEAESLGGQKYETLTVRPIQPKPESMGVQTKVVPGVATFDPRTGEIHTPAPNKDNGSQTQSGLTVRLEDTATQHPVVTSNHDGKQNNNAETSATDTHQNLQLPKDASEHKENPQQSIVKPNAASATFDRAMIINLLNEQGLLTYEVRSVKINNYLNSMFHLGNVLTISGLAPEMNDQLISDVVQMMSDYISSIEGTDKYQELTDKIKRFKLNSQVFDAFGKKVSQHSIDDEYSATDVDIDRQLRNSEMKLGSQGVANEYLRKHLDEKDLVNLKIDIIIYTSIDNNMDKLSKYAENKFHEINDTYRRQIPKQSDRVKSQYKRIVSDGDVVSEHSFTLPDTILLEKALDGKEYRDHLFVNPETGLAKVKLNSWEEIVLKEEEDDPDFVCWYRNPVRKSWSLTIPYEQNGVMKPTYPDFIIVRRDPEFGGYVFDILEPHDPTRTDNVGKAIGFAHYAQKNLSVGRIQLIRIVNGRARRLDMSKGIVREKVMGITTDEELNRIFESDGFYGGGVSL